MSYSCLKYDSRALLAIIICEKGSSLIEALASLVVFMIGALGWLSLETALTKQSGQTHVVSQAVFIAQTQVDLLRQIPYDTLVDSATPEYFDQHGQQTAVQSFFEVTWTVADLPTTDPNYKQVNITVTWDFNNPEFENQIDIQFSRSK